MTTAADVTRFKAEGSWRHLASVAKNMVDDAEGKAGLVMQPRLGGGTRLMLAFEHRISDDIDLFIRDPQWIGYLTPRLNDQFESVIAGYEEAQTSLKLRLAVGEIDFIVSMSLLNMPDDRVEGVPFLLEPVEEVLAKKLFYRGWALTPRDLFDWRAVITHRDPGAIGGLLARLLAGDRLDALRNALEALGASSAAQTTWGEIRAPVKPSLADSIDWGLGEVERYVQRGRQGQDADPDFLPSPMR